MTLHCSFDLPFCSKAKVEAAEDLFMCLLALCVSYLEKYLFRSSTHFLIGVFFFFNCASQAAYIYLELNPLSVASFANTLSSILRVAILFMISFAVQKL